MSRRTEPNPQLAEKETDSNTMLVFALFGGILLFVLSCIYNGHYSQARMKNDLVLQQIEKHISFGELPAAQALLKDLNSQYCSFQCHLVNGTLQNSLGEFVAGKTSCNKAIPVTHNPNCKSIPAIQCLSTSYIGLNNYSMALPYLNKVQDCLNDSTVNISRSIQIMNYQQLYHVYTDINDTQRQSDIITAFSQLLHVKYSTAHKQLNCQFVNDLVRLQQYDKALLYIESSGPVSKSTDYCILQAYHRVLMNKHWYHEALTITYYMIEIATKDTSKGSLGHKLQGETYIALNQTEQAINVLTIAHALNETDSDTLLTLADLCSTSQLQSSRNKSEEYYTKAVDILQSNAPLRVMLTLGRLQLESNKTRRALRTLDLYISTCKRAAVAMMNCSEGYFYLGQAQYSSNDTAGAYQSYIKAAMSPLLHDVALSRMSEIANAAREGTVNAMSEFIISSSGEELSVNTSSDSNSSSVNKVSTAPVDKRDVRVSDNTLPAVVVAAVESSTNSQKTESEPAATASKPKFTTSTGASSNANTPVKQSPTTATPVPSQSSTQQADSPQAQASAEQYLKMARARVQQGNADAALKEITKAIRKSYTYADNYLLRAEIYSTQGKVNEAVADLLYVWNDLKVRNEKTVTGLTKQAMQLVLPPMEYCQLALHLFDIVHDSPSLTASFESDEKYVLAVSSAYAGVGNVTAAIATLDRYAARQQSGENIEPFELSLVMLLAYADLFDTSGQTERAEDMWVKAIERKLVNWAYIGDNHLQRRKFNKAIVYYEKHLLALQHEVPPSNASSDLSETHKKLGRLYALTASDPDSLTSITYSQQVTTTSTKEKVLTAEQRAKAQLQQAYIHFQTAMQLGAHDIEMRRFFAQHPMLDATNAAAAVSTSERTDKSGKYTITGQIGDDSRESMNANSSGGGAATIRTRKVFGRRNTQFKDPVTTSLADNVSNNSNSTVHTLASLSQAASALHSHHRWVVRHIVDIPLADSDDSLSSGDSNGDPTSDSSNSSSGLGDGSVFAAQLKQQELHNEEEQQKLKQATTASDEFK